MNQFHYFRGSTFDSHPAIVVFLLETGPPGNREGGTAGQGPSDALPGLDPGPGRKPG